MRNEVYGMEVMSLNQELNLPEAVRKTRNNKVIMIDQLGIMRQMIDALEVRARSIPTLDSDAHADLVRQLAERIHHAYTELYGAEMFGHA